MEKENYDFLYYWHNHLTSFQKFHHYFTLALKKGHTKSLIKFHFSNFLTYVCLVILI